MMSCCSRSSSLSNRSMTLFASLPLLRCARMTSSRLLVRPSWRKNTRCPTPPKRSCPELIGTSAALSDSVLEISPHVVQQQVGEKVFEGSLSSRVNLLIAAQVQGQSRIKFSWVDYFRWRSRSAALIH